MLAVCFGCRQVNVLGFANFHFLHSSIKAWNHLAGHAHEFKGLAALNRRVEYRAVVERAGVVGADALTFIAHNGFLSIKVLAASVPACARLGSAIPASC